jgi:Arc/MetJ-type ribon-helix-helix transcriptional regulator
MNTPVVAIRLKPELDEHIQKAIQQGRFKSRTEAITYAIEQLFAEVAADG